MESSVLKNASLPGFRGPSPLLRLAPDERLITLVRRGQHAAFEAIVARYQTRLLAFCRHMLASREDAEDVLQEVLAAAFNAILADDREIAVRPWLYRIARNRCLNHLRRQTSIGVDSMDVHFADAGQSTVEKAAGREDFRMLISDIRLLPETQRTALLLREMDALSYEQIAEAMETTVSGVKSLLVRARVSLGEAAEARKLTCREVRLELGAVAEGISSPTAPVRRHVKSCQPCREFRAHLKANNRIMAAALPIGPLLLLKKIALTKLGISVGAGGASSGGAAAGATAAAGGAATAAGGAGAAGGGFAGTVAAGTLATKAVAGLAAAALVTAGAAVEVHRTPHRQPAHISLARSTPRAVDPAVTAQSPQPIITSVQVQPVGPAPATIKTKSKSPAKVLPALTTTTTTAATTQPPLPMPSATVMLPTSTTTPTPTVQQISSSSVLPPQPTAAGPSPTAAEPPQPPVQVILQGTTPTSPAAASPQPLPGAPVAIQLPATAPPAAAAPASGSVVVVTGGTVLANPASR